MSGEILLTLFAWSWAIGLFVGLAVSVYYIVKYVGWVAAVAVLLLGAPLIAFCAVVPFGIIAQADSPNLAVLKRNGWRCTAHHSESTVINTGKTIVPTTTRVCDRYERTE